MLDPGFAIDPATKDSVQVFNWLATSIGGLTAASIGLFQMWQGRRQRRDELRWKKAATALELMTQIHRNPHSSAAVHMLDWWGAAAIELRDGDRVFETSTEEIERVLRTDRAAITQHREQFICDAFDWFFYFIDRIGHLEGITLLEHGDVEPVFAPYIGRIRAKRELFGPLISLQAYAHLARMLEQQPQASLNAGTCTL